MEHKYIRHSTAGFFVWPVTASEVHHRHVAELAKRGEKGEILSAGFVRFEANGPRCYGKSESLSISSMAGDSAALAEQLGLPAAPAKK